MIYPDRMHYAQLRQADPRGLCSNSELERAATLKALQDAVEMEVISAQQGGTIPPYKLMDILETIVSLLPRS